MFGWTKYRLDWSNERKKQLRVIVVCAAIVGYTGFDIIAAFYAPRVETIGTVIESFVSSGRFDDSYFRVRSNSGQIIQLETVCGLAGSLDTTQTVHVVYDEWRSQPFEIEIIAGNRQGVLLPQDTHRVWGLDEFVFLAALAVMFLHVSKFRRGTSSL
jgi:hypothetical protein